MATYLISQATGHQALWTIDYLLAAGAKVHALVRDPAKVPSELQRTGITIFARENDSPEALLKAAQGCKGAYINTFPGFTSVDSEGEQAQVVLDAAQKAGIESVVACTSFYTGDKSKWDNPASLKLVGTYYQSKFNLENVVKNAGFKSYTILRPAFIQHNYTLPHVLGNFPELPKTGTLGHAYNDGARMLHIDEKDIGHYASAALLDPVKFNGAEIELGNDNLTIEETRDILNKVTGKDVKVRKWDEKETKETNEWLFTVRFFLWANIVDMKSVAKENEKKYGIGFTSFEEYLIREKEKVLECLEAGGL
jgi:uncharacterized protein YbjT (DUF2867 family)